MPSLLPPAAPVLARLLAVFSALAAGVPAPAAVPTTDGARAVVSEALNERKSGLLRPLLPAESKVFLDLRTPRPIRGYVGANQVVAVLGEILSSHRAGELDEPRAGESPESTTLRARLRPMKGDGGPALDLRFVLRKGKAGFTLREVREGA